MDKLHIKADTNCTKSGQISKYFKKINTNYLLAGIKFQNNWYKSNSQDGFLCKFHI